MKNKFLTSAVALGLAGLSMVTLTACDKGGSDFSVKSVTNQYQQALTFTPRKLDVLFVVDNSGSMASSQSNLAANFPSFINYFKDRGYDFRIAITTSDAYYGDLFVSNGCSICNIEQTRFRSQTNPKIYVVDPSTPNLESVFAANVQVGTSGSGDERVFSSFKAALSSSLNAGFHRSDAYLAVIGVSDEEDFSQSDFNMNESYSNPNLFPVSDFKTYLESFTGGQAGVDFSFSTISVLDSTCLSQLGSGRKIGTRYMQLADMTGGTKASLCAPFNTVLDSISANIASQTQAIFNLGKKAVESSIRVWVNGVLIPQSTTNGWSYDPVNWTITIKGTYAPASGDQVMIDFDPDFT